MTKTNVMRILEQKSVPYTAYTYPCGKEAVDGATVAKLMGQDPKTVFKTLVTRSVRGGYFVFVVPVEAELDLKKAAKAAGEKAVEMIAVKDINAATGYIRGGCSPIGMKKLYPTVIDASAAALPEIIVSAGKIGYQVMLSPDAIIDLTGGKYAEITV